MTAIRTEPTTPVTEDGVAPLAAALARFQAEMPTVSKTKTADTGTYSYKYADLADVMGAALPVMTAHGLSFATCPRYTEHGYELVGVLLHSSGESMEGALPIHGNSAQQLGSAITYARRYLFGCMTGVVTDDDDDGRAATGPAKTARGPRKKAEPKPVPEAEPQRAKAMRLMFALMRDLGLNDKATSMDYTQKVIGRTIESRNDLTDQELSRVIDALQTRGVSDPPADPGDAVSAASPPSPGSAGPPGPADQDEEYLARVRAEAAQAAPDVAQSTDTNPGPLKPVPGSTVRRIDRFLARELGTMATDAEKQALVTAILGHPKPVENLTTVEIRKLYTAFDKFADGSLVWDYDPNEPPGSLILITEPEEPPGGE